MNPNRNARTEAGRRAVQQHQQAKGRDTLESGYSSAVVDLLIDLHCYCEAEGTSLDWLKPIAARQHRCM